MGGAGGVSGKGKRPIQVKFEIPYFTTSGIQVRYLKIIEPKSQPSIKLRVCIEPEGDGVLQRASSCAESRRDRASFAQAQA
ncbi:hypothetical protein MRB53_041692 [Persea americana]|nr:hypothetical protein MRB53_041692 [Persea americana]